MPRPRQRLSRATTTQAAIPTARMRAHAAAGIGAVSKISFITGQVGDRQLADGLDGDADDQPRLLNSPIRQAGPVSERQLNR